VIIYFLKRVLALVPMLLLISFVSFALVRVAPGGPFDRERKPASPEIEKQLAAKYHLDEPIWRQYLRFLGLSPSRSFPWIAMTGGGLLRGDFGPSLKQRNHTVNDIIAQALPVSLELGMLSFCFALAVGIPLGFYSAVERGKWQDWLGSFLSILFVCIPALVLGPILIMIFAIRWELFPVALWESPWHAVLPTITLGTFFAGKVARLVREGMLGVLSSEFITTARAKGLSETTVLWKHAFPLAALPVISYSGPMLADLFTGSFVVENIFQIPGIGVFMVNSSLARDYTLVVGLVILYASMLLVLNLIVDGLYAFIDPRVRYG
jgi:oligopeptide transport system permease protein